MTMGVTVTATTIAMAASGIRTIVGIPMGEETVTAGQMAAGGRAATGSGDELGPLCGPIAGKPTPTLTV
jgi:hypothetical protein